MLTTNEATIHFKWHSSKFKNIHAESCLRVQMFNAPDALAHTNTYTRTDVTCGYRKTFAHRLKRISRTVHTQLYVTGNKIDEK